MLKPKGGLALFVFAVNIQTLVHLDSLFVLLHPVTRNNTWKRNDIRTDTISLLLANRRDALSWLAIQTKFLSICGNVYYALQTRSSECKCLKMKLFGVALPCELLLEKSLEIFWTVLLVSNQRTLQTEIINGRYLVNVDFSKLLGSGHYKLIWFDVYISKVLGNYKASQNCSICGDV